MLQRLLCCSAVLFALQFVFCDNILAQEQERARAKLQSDRKVSSFTFSQERSTPSLIVMKDGGEAYSKEQSPALLKNYLGLRSSVDELRPVKTSSAGNGLEVIEYQQYFKGIKVEHGGFKVLIRNNNIALLNGAYYDVPMISAAPALAKQQALSKAFSKVNAKKYATDFFREKIAQARSNGEKQALEKELADVSPKGELVIVKDFTLKGKPEMRLAWKFDIYATEPMSRSWIYVDAANGKILLIDPIIKHVNNDPPASVSRNVTTRYAGARDIRVKQISGNDPNSGLLLQSSHPMNEVYVPGTSTWVLVDDTRGKGIETYDLNGVGGVPFSVGAFYAQGKSFTDADNNWSLFEHKRSDPLGNGTGENGAFEAENDDIAWDAHWGAEMVYDYWLQKHNRRSFDDRDSRIRSFIHFGPVYDNAFWNGSVMTYGDGSGPSADGFRALTSLDVCGHEIGHGVCTFTANLVYAHESGAMNEAFSDIWASCVEHFAISSVDGSLVNRYRPFYIGEQIAATVDNPLRRMDNPKFASDPDTYGGQFWKDPNCEPDQLLNDNCGVHTNSGVLNKWFYLLTVGSHNGSGPDAAYARVDSDDGINDLGNSYTITGLGFNVSEQVAYLTELLLTSTATYAEARDASISAATVFSGDGCSNVVRSVTDAWYAVGVGAAFSPACVSTYGFIYQPGNSVSEGNAAPGCAGEHLVNVPVLLPPNSTATVTASGSAVNNVDYRLGTTSLANTTSANKVVDLAVYIISDAVVESNEAINLGITVTNGGSSPVNTAYTLSITEDDIVPVIGTSAKSLLSGGSFNGQADGYGAPAGWSTQLEIPGTNLWGVWGGKLQITGSVEGVQLPPGHYNNISETSTTVIAPQVDGRGLNNIKIRFDFRVQGEVDANSANPDGWGIFDYMTIVYSFDGVNFSELRVLDEESRAFCSLTPVEGNFEMTLPSNFNNQVFYIGFKWYNDTNAGGPESVSIDNVILEGSPKFIEDDLGHNSRENLKPGQEVYFYSVQDGEIAARIKNNFTKDFGCSNVFVEKTGNSAFNLFQAHSGLHKVADKIMRVETSFIYKASQTITLYFTEEQLAALESATNKPRTAFSIYHINGISYAVAANNNTDIITPVYTAIPGAGGSYTFTFTGKANGSYALGTTVSIIGARSIGDNAGAVMERKFGSWSPNPGNSEASILVQSPVEERVTVEVVNLSGQLLLHKQSEQLNYGQNKITLKFSPASSGVYIVRFRNANGIILNSQKLVRY